MIFRLWVKATTTITTTKYPYFIFAIGTRYWTLCAIFGPGAWVCCIFCSFFFLIGCYSILCSTCVWVLRFFAVFLYLSPFLSFLSPLAAVAAANIFESIGHKCSMSFYANVQVIYYELNSVYLDSQETLFFRLVLIPLICVKNLLERQKGSQAEWKEERKRDNDSNRTQI